MLFVLSTSLIWAIETGTWLVSKGMPILRRVMDSINRPVYSLIHHGWGELRDRCLNQQAIQDLIPL